MCAHFLIDTEPTGSLSWILWETLLETQAPGERQRDAAVPSVLVSRLGWLVRQQSPEGKPVESLMAEPQEQWTPEGDPG